jgi:hypothetical protein
VNATEGGPALGGALAATPAGGVGGSRVTVRSGAPRLRTVLGLATVEARMLFRSLLVLAGLLAGGLVIWALIHSVQPLWWNVAWQIGYGQAVLGMAVLIAAHLAAGRARRDGMADLYASFPATAATRTLGQLTGLAGALPASLLLIGGTAAAVQVLGPVGVPGIAALAGGLLLVIAAGAAGIAICTRFPHPLAGVLAGVALFVPVVESNNLNGPGSWLLPWHEPGQLGYLPGPLGGYPPAGAHATELAAIAVLAGTAALAVTAGSARARGLVATAAALAVAVACFAGAAQLRPIPASDLNHLVAQIADPASAQHCTTASQVRYCLYPGFGRDLPSLEAPVSGVLAHLPARPGQPLTVRQAAALDVTDLTIAHGHPSGQLSRWKAQLQKAPGSAVTASAIYLPVGSWPAAGGRLADAHFDLALATAEWAVRLAPAISSSSLISGPFQSCVPVGQAREAIAIWLAILATHPPASELQGGLGGGDYTEVRNTLVALWPYPGSSVGGYVMPLGAVPPTTAAGYLLAKAMTSLPEQKVARVLADAWGSWLNWRTTDAQLAAALGIPMPSVPAPPAGLPSPPTGTTLPPPSPLCTT